jgi:hypothetical protein
MREHVENRPESNDILADNTLVHPPSGMSVANDMQTSACGGISCPS